MTTTIPANWRKTFFIIFSGQAFSLLSSSMVQFSIIWWLTDTTGSAVMLSIASAAGLLPQALLGPVIGTLVDRFDRKKIMILADSSIAAVSLALALLFIAGEPPVWIIFAVLGIRSVATAFHMPAMQSSVPLLAPAEELARIAGWNQFVFSGANLAGPMLGVALLGFWSIEYVLFIDVLGAFIANAALLLVHIPRPQRQDTDTAERGMWKELKYGLNELTKSRSLLTLTLAIAAVTVVYIPVSSLFPLMVRNHFGGGALQAGTVEAAFAGGMILGSLLLGIWGARLKQTVLICGGISILGAGLVVSGLLPSSGLIWFIVCSIVLGISGPLFGGAYSALLQSTVDPASLGRVFSLVGTISLIATPVGLIIAGPMAEMLGVAAWFTISGVLITAVGAGAYLLPSVIALVKEQRSN